MARPESEWADPDWIRTNDVAALLGVRRQYVKHIASREKIRSRKLHLAARRYYRPDLLAMLRRSVVNGPTPEPALAPSPQDGRAALSTARPSRLRNPNPAAEGPQPEGRGPRTRR